MLHAVVSREAELNDTVLDPPYHVEFYDGGSKAGVLTTTYTVAGAVIAALRGAGVVTVYDLTATPDEAPEEETVV
jgi:hypothetical protein